MSEPKETTEKTGAAGGRKPLSLSRTVESGHVQQKIGSGRSKSVVVEKKKKRTLNAPEPEAAPARPGARPTRGGTSSGNLSDNEMVARARALAAAQVRAVEEERQRAEDARLAAAAETERLRKAQEDAARQAAEAREAAIARAREAENKANDPEAASEAAAPSAPPICRPTSSTTNNATRPCVRLPLPCRSGRY